MFTAIMSVLLINSFNVEDHIIARGTYYVFSQDIDSDGDMDLIGSRYKEGEIIWWENCEGSGISWIEHSVDSNFLSASSVYSEDIDGDGDKDILGVGIGDFSWWENIDSLGLIWEKHTLEGYFSGIKYIYSSDLDFDGDMDVLGSSNSGIHWWENVDSSGESWLLHDIDRGLRYSSKVCSADIDNDGDMDVLSSDYGYGFAWWENRDGVGKSWDRHNIDGDYDNSYTDYINETFTGDSMHGAMSVYSDDIDGDGDLDVLGAISYSDHQVIAWWENVEGTGTSWTEHIVDMDFNGAACVYSVDIDSDGDMDILGAACFADDIAVWENINGSGSTWTKYIIDGNFDNARVVHSADLDGNGNMDVIGGGGGITWWDLNTDSPDALPESSSNPIR